MLKCPFCLLQINGVDVTSATHDDAVRLLTSSKNEVTLVVYREDASASQPANQVPANEVTVAVPLVAVQPKPANPSTPKTVEPPKVAPKPAPFVAPSIQRTHNATASPTRTSVPVSPAVNKAATVTVQRTAAPATGSSVPDQFNQLAKKSRNSSVENNTAPPAVALRAKASAVQNMNHKDARPSGDARTAPEVYPVEVSDSCESCALEQG